MNEIHPIYHNDFGMAFQWKRNALEDLKKVQLIFRNTGLLLSYKELVHFSKCIQETEQSGKGNLCQDCKDKGSCRSLLLNTPAHQVSFSVSFTEVQEIKDLIEGTLFRLNLDNYFDELGIN